MRARCATTAHACDHLEHSRLITFSWCIRQISPGIRDARAGRLIGARGLTVRSPVPPHAQPLNLRLVWRPGETRRDVTGMHHTGPDARTPNSCEALGLGLARSVLRRNDKS